VVHEQHRISLKPGDSHTLRLPSRGPAGYDWILTVEGDESALDISRSAAWSPDMSGPPLLPGQGIDQIFEILAVRSGQAVIRFKQCLPFQPEEPPIDERVLAATIEED
jgi:hypothetical protein